MLCKRLIPVLYLMDGYIVRSERFEEHQIIGHPIHHVERLVDWDVDELIIIDISRGNPEFDTFRPDYRNKGPKDLIEFVRMTAVECNIPLTIGGRIRSVEDATIRIQNGADKIAVNSLLKYNPGVVTEIAHKFGSQAVVSSVDYRTVDSKPMAFVDSGRTATGHDVISWAQHAERLGAGEILLVSIDRDGMGSGFDCAVIDAVASEAGIPVIACSGAGVDPHFKRCLAETATSAVAAGNIFHFTEHAYPRIKSYLKKSGLPVR